MESQQVDRKQAEELGEQIAEQAAHLDAATHRLLHDIRVFDQSNGWWHQGALTCARWLVWRLGWDLNTAREHVRVANKLAELPLIDDALRRGEISYSKVRAITRVATAANEAMLLEMARYSTGSQLASICRKYQSVLRHDQDTRPKDDADRRRLTRWDTDDGMVVIHAVLHPEEAATVWAALEHIAKQRANASAHDNADAPGPTAAEQPSTSAQATSSLSSPAATDPARTATSPAIEADRFAGSRETAAAVDAGALARADAIGPTRAGTSAEHLQGAASSIRAECDGAPRSDHELGSASHRPTSAEVSLRPISISRDVATTHTTRDGHADQPMTGDAPAASREDLRRTRASAEVGQDVAIAQFARESHADQPMTGDDPAASREDLSRAGTSAEAEQGVAIAHVTRECHADQAMTANDVASRREDVRRAGTSAEVGQGVAIAHVTRECCKASPMTGEVHASPSMEACQGDTTADMGPCDGMTGEVHASPRVEAGQGDTPVGPCDENVASRLGTSAEVGDAEANVARRAVPGTASGSAGVSANVPIAPREAPLRPSFSRADALVLLAEEVLRGGRRERSPVELVVSVAAETLHADPARAVDDPTMVGCMADGTCVSMTALRRLACDCGVVDQVEDEHGIALSVGRRRRTIPGAMKRALLRRDRTCRFPGCDNRVFLQGHHIEHWIDGGETKLRNMICLCTRHHRYVHEYGYTVDAAADGSFTFRDSLGRVVANHPEPAQPTNRGWPAIRAANQHLGITSQTPACNWTGEPVQYHLQVGILARLDDAA